MRNAAPAVRSMCDLYVDHNLMCVPCVCFGLLELTRFRADFLALGRIIQGVFLPIFLHDDVKDVVQKFSFLAQSRFALGQFRLGSISVRLRAGNYIRPA